MLYKTYIITGMKKLLVSLPDDIAKELEKSVNMNETVREALRVYNGDISTEGIKKSYTMLTKYMETKFEYYDRMFAKLDKLISMLETRL